MRNFRSILFIVLCGFSLFATSQTKRLKVSVNYLPQLERHLSAYDLNVFILDSNNNQKTVLIPKGKTVLIDSLADSISLFFICHAYCDSAEKEFIRYFPSMKLTADSIGSLDISFPLACNYNYHAFDKTCPKCKKDNQVLPILYGDRMPLYNEKGEIIREDPIRWRSGGGDCNSLVNCCPSWYCEEDQYSF